MQRTENVIQESWTCTLCGAKTMCAPCGELASWQDDAAAFIDPAVSSDAGRGALTETMRAECVYEGEDNSFRWRLSEVRNRDGVRYDRSIELSADTFPAGTVISIMEPKDGADD